MAKRGLGDVDRFSPVERLNSAGDDYLLNRMQLALGLDIAPKTIERTAPGDMPPCIRIRNGIRYRWG
jgi:hypothetical protein